MVSIVRSLLKGEAPGVSADWTHPLSRGRPFKFSCHLVGSLEINNIIAMSDINIHSNIFNTDMDTDTDKDMDKDMDKDTDTDKDTDKDKDTEMGTDTDLDLELEFCCKIHTAV